MDYPEAGQIAYAIKHGGPDPVSEPRAFSRWLEARRDQEAIDAGDYPVQGKGWVLVRA
jgi:hypothetical protein